MSVYICLSALVELMDHMVSSADKQCDRRQLMNVWSVKIGQGADNVRAERESVKRARQSEFLATVMLVLLVQSFSL